MLLPNNTSIFLHIWLNSWLHFLPFLRGAEEEEEGEGEGVGEGEAMIHLLMPCLLLNLLLPLLLLLLPMLYVNLLYLWVKSLLIGLL